MNRQLIQHPTLYLSLSRHLHLQREQPDQNLSLIHLLRNHVDHVVCKIFHLRRVV